MTAPKILKLGLLSLIGLEIGLSLAYLMAVWFNPAAPPWLDLNGLRSVPSLLQALHLVAIGSVALLVLLLRHRMQRPVSWVLPLALTVLCFYGGIDEVTKIHLYLNQYNWKSIYLMILVAIPLLCWRDFCWLWQAHRTIVLWVLAGLSIFLVGGFGAEAVKQVLHSAFAAESTITLAGQQNSLLFLAEHLRITLEEFAELLGETLILFGVVQFALQSLAPTPTLAR